jgi:two-component sensor histidine kinase
MPKSLDEFDWATTPLGPKSAWTPALMTAYQIMMGTGFAACATWGPEQTLLYNAAYIPFLGAKHPAALGQPIQVVWHEVWDDIRPLVEQTLGGERVYLEDLPLVINRWGVPEDTFWTFSYSPLRDGETIMGMLDIAIETTGRVRAEQHRQMLVEESGHRVKNTLALVQAVAHQTLNVVADRDSVERFEERLKALGRAQKALQKSAGQSGDLGEVIGLALSNLTGQQAELTGPPVTLSPRAAQAVSLVVHELATNAFKYGALSVAQGRLTVDWDVSDNRLTLNWVERHGPTVIPPKRNGFGSKLLRRGLTGEGAVELSFDPEGFHASFSTSLASLRQA